MEDSILEMKSITKEFPGVKALDQVTFSVARGEIHCLVGENGAGKSTLMKVLSGVHPYGSYSGEIYIDGVLQKFSGIRDSERAGIAIIYQELALIPELSVYENIFLGNEIRNGLVIDTNETIKEADEILKKVGLDVSPEAKVKTLGVGKQQLIEIAKALKKEVKLLILDEPTAALNENDSDNLLEIIKGLKAQGVTCILISHKLREVLSIADTITVLRDGKTICTLDNKEHQVTDSVLIKHMVGRSIDNVFPRREKITPGEEVLRLENWSAYSPSLGRDILKDINISVRAGEIVGIAGLMGSGRTELAKSIFGNPDHYKVSGSLWIKGKEQKFKSPNDAIRSQLAYVTEDRKGNGLILIDDVRHNITLANLKEIAQRGVINENEEIVIASEYKQSLNIKTPSIEQKVRNLSGGNQQKVSLGKWLFVKPGVMILDEPTRGIDVGAKYEIYTIMNSLVEKGMSIIMISSELPEILGMSDRVYVMSAGRIKGELSADEFSQEKIMALAVDY
ncbi:MAG: sugar ABC transporter ATP-binding protein [Chloroflexi bacterium]|nr:sugar ABC transporter ATP-binding protein [Anaerolineaceae bacterium]NLI45464.1 sugar ABC transporter ATP-binding protein [Chloroflexota bacterium]HOE35172.1 sugar ABC transporter ATP-binding protein [Anaerolineaceae bacterium]HOT26277.1 sugar ABC transporter ATP-binding protein [Anaerolineaceae bacterium]HQK04254.1 sugar ABC transporter ATP-binding protein [Anaerolineaceae bacterium]